MIKITKRKKVVIIRFLPSEREEIEKYSDDSKVSISEFIREAVRDKIRRIKKPELFERKGGTVKSAAIEDISDKLDKSITLQEVVVDKTSVLPEMSKQLIRLYNLSARAGLSNERSVVEELFKAHKSLTLKKIIETSGIKKEFVEEIVKILIDEGRIRVNPITGRFELE